MENAMDRLSDLPEPVLHRILYFLTNKEVARTCVLSKSWRHIWSNRQQLCLSDKGNKKDFVFQADKTLQSLLDQNHHGIREFTLTIYTLNSQSLAFLLKWVPRLAAISIKYLYLHILPNHQHVVGVDLPFEAFAAKSLRILHLHRCNLLSLMSPQDHNKQLLNIPFKDNLQILRLRHVSVNEQDNIVDKIVSSCRYLTSMLFEQCRGLTNLDIINSHRYLRDFTFIAHHSYTKEDCRIRIVDLPNVETIKIVGSRVLFGNREYSKLRSLYLKKVEMLRNSFDKSSSCSFPILEDFVFVHYSGGLTCIDAPSLVRFEYLGSRIPTFSFTPTFRNWRSNITLLPLGDAQSWFLNLSKFLHSLSHSEITLRILNLGIPQHPPLPILENIGNNKPVVVESLQLGGDVPWFPAFFYGLFCICRPRYIAHCRNFNPPYEMKMMVEQKELVEFLCSILMNTNQHEEEIRQHHHHHLPSDVKFQSFDSGRGEWQFTDQNSLAQFASINTEIFRKVRFVLTWSQDC